MGPVFVVFVFWNGNNKRVARLRLAGLAYCCAYFDAMHAIRQGVHSVHPMFVSRLVT